MTDVSEGNKLKREIDTLLQNVANIDKNLVGGKKHLRKPKVEDKKIRKTKTKSKGKKMTQDGGKKKARKPKTKSKSKSNKNEDELVQLGGKKKARKPKTKSKSKSNKNEDELVQLGGKKKAKKTKSKSQSKERKQKRPLNSYMEALNKLRVYIKKDADLTEGLGIPFSVQLNKLLKAGDKDYNKALDLYKKDKEGFKSDLKKEIANRSKK